MIKNLLTVVAVTSTLMISAQTGKMAKEKTINLVMPAQNTAAANKIAMPVCDTISVLTGTGLTLSTASSDTATPGCSPEAGYVVGTNCYGDLEKTAYFAANSYSALVAPQVSGVIVGFYKSGTEGTGGVATNTIGVKIYVNSTFAAGPGTGAALGTAALTMSNVLASFVGTAQVGLATFNFAAPITVPATNGFWASVVLPNQNTTDTAVVLQEATATASVSGNNSWEKWNDNTWHNMNTAWQGGFYRMFVLPIMNCSGVTGINANTELDNSVKVLPNPSTGLVNVVSTLSNESTITVTDAVGRTITSKVHNPALGYVTTLDLSAQSNGVYFVTISNGSAKSVKRLILNK